MYYTKVQVFGGGNNTIWEIKSKKTKIWYSTVILSSCFGTSDEAAKKPFLKKKK